MAIDFAQQLADMQAAMRALWPDRPVVYFTEASGQSMGPGPVLTDEERNLLHRVANTIGAARNSEEQIARTTAVIEEAAVFDFVNWLTAQNITLARWDSVADGGLVPLPEGELWERWKTERGQ